MSGETTFLLLVLCCSLSAQETRPDAAPAPVRVHSGKLTRLLDPTATVAKVAGGFVFTEGPVWDERGFLYISDERGNRIYRVFPDGRREPFADIGDPDGNTLDRRGTLITCASIPRAVLAMDDQGKSRVLADRYEGKRFSSPNDIVSGPDGALYFTDPTLDLPKGEKQEIPFQGVYRLAQDGTVTLLIRDLQQPNGLAFSPDGRRLYVDDSRTRNIHVYDFHQDGTVGSGRVFGTEQGPPRTGGADGMRVDTRGNLFATGPEGIWVWSPEGVHLGTILLPEPAANLTWGDADYKTLYITASTSVYRLRTRTRGFVPWKAPLKVKQKK